MSAQAPSFDDAELGFSIRIPRPAEGEELAVSRCGDPQYLDVAVHVRPSSQHQVLLWGARGVGEDPAWDAAEAQAMYALLERDVIPAFYTRRLWRRSGFCGSGSRHPTRNVRETSRPTSTSGARSSGRVTRASRSSSRFSPGVPSPASGTRFWTSRKRKGPTDTSSGSGTSARWTSISCSVASSRIPRRPRTWTPGRDRGSTTRFSARGSDGGG